MSKFHVNANPCDTCPYRKDTPAGIWHKSEYKKLPAWDNPLYLQGPFLCHNTGQSRDTICRGWMEVHHQNFAVRLIIHETAFNASNSKPTKVPLYASGQEAMQAGIKGIAEPSCDARQKIAKLYRTNKFKTK